MCAVFDPFGAAAAFRVLVTPFPYSVVVVPAFFVALGTGMRFASILCDGHGLALAAVAIDAAAIADAGVGRGLPRGDFHAVGSQGAAILGKWHVVRKSRKLL